MSPSATDHLTLGRRYALCVGIGTYTNLHNKTLRFAVDDAKAIAKRLEGSLPDSFEVTLLTEPPQTSKAALDEAVECLLSAPDRQAEDLAVIYFSCHGELSTTENTFYLLPSNAAVQSDGGGESNTIIGISDIARWFSQARTRNIVMLLDVCHSGGAGVAIQHFELNLSAGPNYFIIGCARQDQKTWQSSQLGHGLFTHCLLRAFEQPPTKDGWLTISQIHTFVSEEISWFARDHPIEIQGVSISVNPNLPLVRNPSYPELCPLPPIWQIPLQRNPFFTEQDGLLDRLAAMLQRNQKTALTQPQAISGLGGIGKTQLALEYAYRHRQDYHAVLWSRADTREALISTFVTIAHLLDLPQKDEQDQMVIVQAVKTWLMDRSKWLLILDNVDELAMVKEFWPPAFQGHLLLTTRAQVMGGLARKFEVEVMGPEVGALLLLRRAGLIGPDAPLEQASSADVTVAKELSEEMGGLPLVLDQAGAYIEEVSCSPQDYQRLYQTRRAELLKERGGIVPDHPESVATTWSLAFQKVEQSNPVASDLLRLCAFLHPDAIPEEMIARGAEHLGPQLRATASDPVALNKAITALRAYSLISRDSAMHTLAIHRLVQAVLRDDLNADEQRKWAELAVRVVSRSFPDVFDVTQWLQCNLYLPHALACAELIEQWEMEFAEALGLMNEAGVYLQRRGWYTEAEPLYARALRVRKKVLGPEHPYVAESLTNLAGLYCEQGRYEEAEPLYTRALRVWEKVLGLEHPAMAQCLNDLAALYHIQGKYEEAELLHARALQVRENILGLEHPDVAQSLSNLAAVYETQGKYEEAEPLYTRALKIAEKALGPEHPNVVTSLNNLGTLYYVQGRYKEAMPLYIRALQVREKALGPEHPNVVTSLNNLAGLYEKGGRYEEAELLYARALQVAEKALGPQHLLVSKSLNNLAVLYYVQGKYEKAEPLYTRALKIAEKALGPEHPEVAGGLNNLGELYSKQERYTEAELLHARALQVREKALGPEHPDVAESLNNLAILYRNQGRYERAEPFFTRALQVWEKAFGSENPHVATSLNNLAGLYQEQGRYEEAEPLYVRALVIMLRTFGPRNPDVMTILENYVGLLQAMKFENIEAKLEGLGLKVRIRPKDGPDWEKSKVVNVSGLSDEAGADLFLALLPQDCEHLAPSADRQALSRRAQGDPLSIRLLAGRFAESTTDLATFLKHIEAELGAAEQATPISLENPKRQRTLYACMDYSVKRLTPDQREVLDIVSIFQGPFRPEFATYVLNDDQQTPVHLQNLVHLGLLNMDIKTFREGELVLLDLHPMLRRYIQHYLSGQDPALLERYGEVYKQLARGAFLGEYDQSTLTNYLLRQSLPDCEAALQYLLPASRADLAYDLAKPYLRLGQYSHSLAVLELALELNQELGEVRKVAGAQQEIANVLVKQGKRKEAMALYEQSLQVLQELGDIQGATAVRHEIADLLVLQGKLEEAMALYEQSLQAFQELGDTRGVAVAQYAIADILKRRGRLEEALALYQQSLHVCQELNDVRSATLARSGIADVLKQQGKLEEAMDLYEQALHTLKELGEIRSVATTQGAMARLLMQQGKLEEAMSLNMQVLHTSQDLGDVHGVAFSQQAIADLLVEQEKPGEAMTFYEQALSGFQHLGEMRQVAAIQHSMANLLKYRGKIREAMVLCEQAVRTMQALKDVREAAKMQVSLCLILLEQVEPRSVLRALSEAWDTYIEVSKHGFLPETQVVQELLIAMKEALLGPAQFDRLWKQVIRQPQPGWLRNMQPNSSGQGISKIPDEILQAVHTFLNTVDWNAKRQVVEAQQALLFQPQVETLLEQNIARSRSAENQKLVEILELHLALLRDCKKIGVAKAFGQHKNDYPFSQAISAIPKSIPSSRTQYRGIPKVKPRKSKAKQKKHRHRGK